MMLYTIGFTQKSLRQFMGLLREAQVDGVVDIRLRNVSQLAGFAKRDDLAFILELCGIGYRHEPRLAPSDELLDRYHRDHDWAAYEPDFAALLAQRDVPALLAEIERRFARPCLLCTEPEPDQCHRRLVAEAFVRLRPGLEVRNLVLPRPRKAAASPRAARRTGRRNVPAATGVPATPAVPARTEATS
ncbi:MAG TPA: DUF488 domain-containing protein [Ktedonobacterales bacterium]|jgi:uncharacterized protein (DUF488 family)|nr:DUF488 domain-containing protein [Ktedonobacterales bacterium]